ncbi:MAG: response regulator transcription factor [Bryobacteraceae bacterium]
MQTVLVIEGDQQQRDRLVVLLADAGYRPLEAGDGRNGYEKTVLHRPDLILLDVPVVGMSGVELCRRIRDARLATPIIALSERSEETDKVLLLEAGADDYVVKPFGMRELLARIRALLRRMTPHAHKVYRFGEAEVDLDRRAVARRGAEVPVTRAEFNLLAYFLQNPGKPLTRDTLLNVVWGYDCFPNTRTVDAHVGKLRHKLEPEPAEPRHFLTLHRVGYRFVP